MKKYLLELVLLCLFALFCISCVSGNSDEATIALATTKDPCIADPKSSDCCKYQASHYKTISDYCCDSQFASGKFMSDSCCRRFPHDSVCIPDFRCDWCCEGTSEKPKCDLGAGLVKAEYGTEVDRYLDYVAKSNGVCTGTGVGLYQCLQFAEDFFADRLNHTVPPECGTSWVSGGAAFDNGLLQEETIAAKEVAGTLTGKADPLFFFHGSQELPRETDMLTFTGATYGHVVIGEKSETKDGISWNVRVIEENVAIAGETCHRRKLNITKGTSGYSMPITGLGSLYSYQGIIRHNLAGSYGDNGWHTGGTSDAFRAAYQTYGRRLGWAFDNGGGPFVHDFSGLSIQDFKNDGKSVGPSGPAFGDDGETAIILNADMMKAFVLKEAFWGTYKCLTDGSLSAMGGATLLGPPASGEKSEAIDDKCNVLSSGTPVNVQHFKHGCMWWGMGPECPDTSKPCAHVHSDLKDVDSTHKGKGCDNVAFTNNPPGPGELTTDGSMSLDPLTHGWKVLAYNGNSGHVDYSFGAKDGTAGDGAYYLQAKTSGEADWSAQFVDYVSVKSGDVLTACLSAKSTTSRSVTIFLQKEFAPYTSYGLWQSVALTGSFPTSSACTTFTIPSGVSDTAAKFGMDFGDNTSVITVDSLTLMRAGTSSAPPPTPPPTPPPPSKPTEICNGLDDDGNGLVDEIFACRLGDTKGPTCVTSCGPSGMRICEGPSCTWGTCMPFPEDCSNTIDDDCNGLVDCADPACSSTSACKSTPPPSPPPPPPTSSTTDVATDGTMALDPLTHGWQIIAYDGNYENVDTSFLPSGGVSGDGAFTVRAKAVGLKDYTAEFANYVTVKSGDVLTACASMKSSSPRNVAIFLQQDLKPWTSYELWSYVTLGTSFPMSPTCFTFTVPSGVSDTHARFGMNFGDNTSTITVDSFTLTKAVTK